MTVYILMVGTVNVMRIVKSVCKYSKCRVDYHVVAYILVANMIINGSHQFVNDV
jgi:hypothetical protein